MVLMAAAAAAAAAAAEAAAWDGGACWLLPVSGLAGGCQLHCIASIAVHALHCQLASTASQPASHHTVALYSPAPAANAGRGPFMGSEQKAVPPRVPRGAMPRGAAWGRAAHSPLSNPAPILHPSCPPATQI